MQAAGGQSVGIIRQTALQCDLQPPENIHCGIEKTERMLFGKSREFQKLVSHTSCEEKNVGLMTYLTANFKSWLFYPSDLQPVLGKLKVINYSS